MNSSQITQDSISDSQEIFERIKYELSQAQSEILLAMAWFTDPDLFQILIEKLADGIKVDVIISDQEDNSKLDFDALQNAGADFIKIKNVGYGMMHQKFCIIDRKVAITGSYNWTVNARKNNHENIIVTTYKQTVDDLISTFFQIKNRAIRMMNGETIQEMDTASDTSTIKQPIATTQTSVPSISFQEQSLKDFKDVLDNIIATEVGSFDKDLLKNSGYNRAKENNGDHQVLPQAMDSLYSNFINEIEVIDEKKSRLRSRIEEQQKLSTGNVELKTESDVVTLKENLIVTTKSKEQAKNDNLKSIEEKTLKTKSNNETKIPFLEDKILNIEKQISALSVDFVKPPLNKFLTWSLWILLIALFLYIFVFYSSVAYIFVFSKEDTMAMMTSGAVTTEMPEVFNAHAISKIWNKGVGGVMFQFLFIFIPIALGMFKILNVEIGKEHLKDLPENGNTNAKTFLERFGGLFLIVIVDVFVAYKVSKNINTIGLLTRETDHELSLGEILADSNFWLVFVLGTLGVYLFSLVINKIYEFYNSRNVTIQEAKSKFQITQLQQEIEELKLKINGIKSENDELLVEISNLEKDNKQLSNELNDMPLKLNEKVSTLQQQLLSFKEKIANIANIYRSQVDNDKLPISKAEMENRINIFVEGWSKYLHDTYSITIAETKTHNAIAIIEDWLASLSFQPINKKSTSFNNLVQPTQN